MRTNTVLVISSNAGEARVLARTLDSARDGPFTTEVAHDLASAQARVAKGGVDIVLVDLYLPDSSGIETFDTLFRSSPTTPIMAIVDEAAEDIAIETVQHGAQGYLSKGHFQDSLVPQALRSIIERKKIEEALFVEKERARVTLDSIGDGVLSTDVAGNVTYLNRQAERMIGWSSEEASGRPVAEVFQLVDGDTGVPRRNPVEVAIVEAKRGTLEDNSTLVRRDGVHRAIEDSVAPILDATGAVTGAVVTFHDVSELRAMAGKMAHQAQHDFLTGLPNRMLLTDRLTHAIAHAERHQQQLAVLFLDLDNFKHINDSLGHAFGDELLRQIATRLIAQVRHSDTVSRPGGDEFILLLENSHAENVVITAEKILNAIILPYHINGHELHVTASIGISLYPLDGGDAESLTMNADAAMYHAKHCGKNSYALFNADMNAMAVARHGTEAGLRQALEHGQLHVHYQPRVDLTSGKVSGAEALVRWEHPEKGLLMPDAFIAVAEDSGLIIQIGDFVLREACRQAKSWVDLCNAQFQVAVNVSSLQFRDGRFHDRVREILEDTALPAQCLQLELTEGVLMRNAESTLSILQALKRLGVQIAVDDFGTGYSSLSYLTRFPIDTLKIDKSFVQHIAQGLGDGIIVSTVIRMGESLRQNVIAEGVETQEQVAFLRAHDCKEAQGYLFGRPMAAKHFGLLL